MIYDKEKRTKGYFVSFIACYLHMNLPKKPKKRLKCFSEPSHDIPPNVHSPHDTFVLAIPESFDSREDLGEGDDVTIEAPSPLVQPRPCRMKCH